MNYARRMMHAKVSIVAALAALALSSAAGCETNGSFANQGSATPRSTAGGGDDPSDGDYAAADYGATGSGAGGGGATGHGDCAAYASHVHGIVSTQGSARTRQFLQPAAQLQARCEAGRPDAALLRCYLAASTAAAVDECAIGAFAGPIDATPRRNFDPGEGELTQDGDFMRWDADCGLLFKSKVIAEALFVVCDGRVQIGPIVNVDVLDQVVARISSESRSRHEMVMQMINNRPTGTFNNVPVHVYDQSTGRYVRTEYR